MHPYLESAPDRYCRLFRPSAIKYVDWRDIVTQVGGAMTDHQPSQSWNRPILPISAGYTYFGQFLDHDLTKDQSSLEDAVTSEPHQLVNQETPKLDLSHLYGDGPSSKKNEDLYENQIRFKLGDPGKYGRAFDVYIDPITNKRVLADDRSGENWILRQITAMFYRLHNFAVDHCDPAIAGLPPFERARLQATWQFQWLVIGDYLRTVLDSDVYRTVFEGPQFRPHFEWKTFSIPIEFSVAAMRFGHSMVRPSYQFSEGLDHELSLKDIFGFSDDLRGKIPDEFEINWGFFFQGAAPDTGNPLTARPIDTQITDPLYHLPAKLVRLFSVSTGPAADNPPQQLPVRSLRRGTALRLPPGRVVAEAFGISPLTEDELIRNSRGEITESGILLKRYGMIEAAPLWYYILRESEVWHNGNRLGPTGSYLIAETIHAALRYDPDSYLNRNGGRPPIWTALPDGNHSIDGLSELFRLAGTTF